MRNRFFRHAVKAVVALPFLLLAACSGPEMKVTRAFGGGVLIENTGEKAFTVERVVANGSPDNSNCNNYTRRTVQPGGAHTVVFLLCGSVNRLEVQTDQGASSFSIP